MDIEAVQQDPSWRLRSSASAPGQNGFARVSRATVTFWLTSIAGQKRLPVFAP
jgi:hypothetical protein